MDTTNQQLPATRTESNNPTTGQKLLTTTESEAIYPVVLVKVNVITCSTLLDTGAGSSYISSTLARKLKKQPIRTDYKQIETTLHANNVLIDIYDVEITNTKGDFSINTKVSKFDRAELISMQNPHYDDIIQTYTHLQRVQMEESDNKEFLPVHVILGASEYVNMKTKKYIKVGQKGEPVTEYTTFG